MIPIKVSPAEFLLPHERLKETAIPYFIYRHCVIRNKGKTRIPQYTMKDLNAGLFAQG